MSLREEIKSMFLIALNESGMPKQDAIERAEVLTEMALTTISKHLPEKKYTPLNMPNIPEPDATVIRAEIEYWNKAIDEVNKLLTTSKKKGDSE